ncbi:unnamed protein product [Phaeothamnion confervicola]
MALSLAPRGSCFVVHATTATARLLHASPWQRLKSALAPFTRGCGILWDDVMWARKVSMQLKAGEDVPPLDRRRLKQVHLDLARSAPAVAFFAVPIAGYLSPILALRYPKQLLSRQFWLPEHRRDFLRWDLEYAQLWQRQLRVLAGPALLVERANARKYGEAAARGASAGAAGEQWPERLSAEQLRSTDAIFRDNGGALGLDALGRAHLLALTRSWPLLLPLTRAVLPLLPAPLLARFCRRLALRVLEDDALLLAAGGAAALSGDDLRQACADRGLTADLQDEESMRRRLDRWLAAHLRAGDRGDGGEAGAGESTDGSGRAVPASAVLHAPAILNVDDDDDDDNQPSPAGAAAGAAAAAAPAAG